MYVHSITADGAATDTSPVLRVAGESRGPGVRDPYADSVRRHEGGHTVWRVQCGDLISRHRCVTVFVEDGEVVLVGPPGETARLSRSQLTQLKAALDEAAELAER